MGKDFTPTTQHADAATVVVFDSPEQMVATLGAHDEVLRVIAGLYPEADLLARGNEVRISGEPLAAARALRLIGEARSLAALGTRITAGTVEQLVRMLNGSPAGAQAVLA